MPFQILHDSLTSLRVDAIATFANPLPGIGSDIDQAVHRAAGPTLLAERQAVGRIAPGQAAATPAGNLDARVVIHGVAPPWREGVRGEVEQLSTCYLAMLKAALNAGCTSVAIPLLSASPHGFPRDQALTAAVEAVRVFLDSCAIEVYLVVADRKSYRLPRPLHNKVAAYVYEQRKIYEENARRWPEVCPACGSLMPTHGSYCTTCGNAVGTDRLGNPVVAPKENEGLSFSELLEALIENAQLGDQEFCRRANIDRNYLSRCRRSSHWRPSKETALAMAMALRLDAETTATLLASAGYSFSRSAEGDLIIRYFIAERIYDVLLINEVLFAFRQPQLGR